MALSAQDFIRALRATADPPSPGGPTKVQIATQVWNNPALYVPNKGEAIIDWLLSRFLKDKDKDPANNPLLDERYWILLRDVLLGSDATKSRSVRAWIVPILQRTPLAPVVIVLLSLWPRDGVPPTLVSASAECLSILWPLAVPKLSTEVLLDCVTAVVKLLRTSAVVQNARVEPFLQQILASYRYSLANASNKKKIFTAFVQNHLQDWFQCVDFSDTTAVGVRTEIYEAGVETMFNVDILRQAQDRDDFVYLERRSLDMTADGPAVCRCYPRLLGSYIQITRRHRAALFGQSSHQAAGSSAEQARLAALKFYTLCDSSLSLAGDSGVAWKARVRLLHIVDSEGLYGVNSAPVAEALRRTGEDSLGLLAKAIQDGSQPQVEHALDALSTITHIDYDLLSHTIPRVLPLLLAVPPSTTPAYAYLRHLLAYHTKTRTVDLIVDALLTACVPQTQNGIPTPQPGSSSSPIFRHAFLDVLAESLTAFLTPGQVTGTVDTVLRFLREHLEALNVSASRSDDDNDKPQRKKRKTETTSLPVASDESQRTATAFSLMSRIASTVLSSLPTRYLLDDTETRVREAVQDLYASTRSTLKDTLKGSRRADGAAARDLQGCTALLVRLRYSLRTAAAVRVPTDGDARLAAKLLAALGAPPVLTELRVQILRTLLSDVDRGLCEPERVFDEVLNLLELGQEEQAIWQGNVDEIQTDAQAVVAMCYLVFNRWLPLFDASASPEQLARLAKLLTSSHFTAQSATVVQDEAHITLPIILQQALHNAETWELLRFRDALLEQINAATKPLDAVDVAAALQLPKKHKAPRVPEEHVSPIIGTYRLLLYIPIEYLSRNVRNELLRRALAADVVLGGMDAAEHAQSALFFREFLRRLCLFMGTAEHPIIGPYLGYMLQQRPTISSRTFTSTTSELVRIHLSVCVRSCLKGEQELLQDVTKHFTTFVANQSVVEGRQAEDISWHGLMSLIDIFTTEAKPEEFNEGILDQLKALYQRLSSALAPHITAASSQESHDVAGQALLLRLWHHSLVLHRWLYPGDGLASFGKAIVTKLLLSSQQLDATCSPLYLAALAIIQEECRSGLETQQTQDLEVVLASYLAFFRACDRTGRRELDELMARFFKTMSAAGFSDLLELVLDGLSKQGLSLPDVASVVHVYSVLLQNAPEGSSKAIQASLSRCLQLFAAKQEFLRDTFVRDETLQFIARQFNERPALIRQLDLSSVWSILGSCLEGSTVHESSTDKAAFHAIVSTISALIRLRRDLITSTLPHLAFTLRRLLLSLRHLRPQLGAKQSRLVTDTLPRWIHPGSALGADEAKALARLLTTLTTKTVVRGQAGGGEAGKAESLARPFAKHAAYVLQAYIEALNDPLCVLPADTRKELEPGLFALCEMMGEHSRDALMVASLDTGGKTVLKTIWREYEKQKYVGRG